MSAVTLLRSGHVSLHEDVVHVPFSSVYFLLFELPKQNLNLAKKIPKSPKFSLKNPQVG